MRIEQITFTRFWAALAIVIYHFGKGTAINNEYTSHLFSNVGVSYFFILSGFVMIIAYQKTEKFNLKKYFINRFARIYPLYLFALLLIIFLKVVFKQGVNFTELIYSITVIQAWSSEYVLSLNGPGWSISVEIFFYFLFPLLLLFFYQKHQLKTVITYIIVFCLISQFFFQFFILSHTHEHDWFEFFYYSPIMHLGEFLIGNVAGLFFLNYRNDYANSRLYKYNSFLILLCLLVLLLLLKYPLLFNYHNGFLAIVYIPLILFLSFDKGWITKLLNLKPFVFLGEISYGVYLLQLPIYKLSQILFKILKLEFSFYWYLVVLILSASISYLLFENPVRNFIKSKLSRS